jgi:Protein of unknown function (DUF1036)
MRFLLALLLLAVSGSQALAAIKFCNNFEHRVQFAVAFQDQDGWVSEGWISVAPKACQTDSKHADLTEFCWRGETDWIKTKGGRTQWSWGKDRQFSVKDGSFAFKNSDQKLKGPHLVGFIGPVITLNPSDERKARIENALSSAYVDREALRINPNNVVGLNNRGAVYTSTTRPSRIWTSPSS